MALLFALFGKLLIAKQGYVADMGFLMVYVGIVLLLLQSFTLIGRVVEEGVSRMLSFMTAFVPAYAATLLLSGNSASAGFFYEVTLGILCDRTCDEGGFSTGGTYLCTSCYDRSSV